MSIIHSPTHLPVFHHIPKNVGTYVLSWAQMLCRKYHMMRGENRSWHWTSAKIRRGLIPLIDGRQLTIIYFAHPDFPEYHLVNSQIISNFSLPIDANTIIESVKKQYPQTIILHKKWN